MAIGCGLALELGITGVEQCQQEKWMAKGSKEKLVLRGVNRDESVGGIMVVKRKETHRAKCRCGHCRRKYSAEHREST